MLLVAVMVVGGMPVRARAALVSDHHVSTGNGRYNRNSVTFSSPEYNRGIQHITNTNAGGIHNTEAAFCKRKFRHCRIIQRQSVFDP